MFRLFGVLGFGRRVPASAVRSNPNAYAEALFAGWVPPPGAPAAARLEVSLPQSAARQNSDGVTFLERVYRNQEC